MTFDDKIKAAYQAAAAEKWSYPQLFEGLKAAGVRGYAVDAARHIIEYFGEGESVIHDGPPGYQAEVAEFNEAAIIQAIRRAQRRETDYQTFLKQIAAGGVSTYRVDMGQRTISYLGKTPSDAYVERVP